MNARPQHNIVRPFRELRLLDAPLVLVSRRDRIEQMACDLVRYDAAQNEEDAVRSLFGRGYSTAEIYMLLDEARQVAFQKIVAEEMARP